MTITDNGRVEVDESTLAKARAFVADVGTPSKREMQKHLGKRWNVVNEVLTRLSKEARQEREQRRRATRQAMRRLAARKRPGSTRPIPANRQRTVNETARRRPKSWPLILLALPAFAAVWSGWVGLGGLTGFGVVQPFPGIPGLDSVRLDTAITLPIGVETYGAYALYVWLSGLAPTKLARRFAMWSAFGSLMFGAAGQVAFHEMVAAGMSRAPWQITTVVACLPVAVLGMGAALRHLVHAEEE